MTAETAIIKMSRLDCTVPWGFRLQGGKDYMSPMIINRIIQGGLAEKSGLREGDFLIEILKKSTDQMSHCEAQELIMSCSNDLEMKVERTSARIWAPLIKPVAIKPDDQNGTPVKYSIAHDHGHQPWNSKSTTPFDTSVRTIFIDGPSVAKKSDETQHSKKENEEPAYLRSETLKFINESEKRNKSSFNDFSSETFM
uniref:PDZ domain-containing protein n=1 Tax=Romanomermis culicivorax TaxID=13658 RepID=A0A915HGH0_ROMCU